MAFVPKFVKPDGLEVEVASDEPCLCFVGPLLVIPHSKQRDTGICEQDKEVTDMLHRTELELSHPGVLSIHFGPASGVGVRRKIK
jgi:hypothetical protein